LIASKGNMICGQNRTAEQFRKKRAKLKSEALNRKTYNYGTGGGEARTSPEDELTLAVLGENSTKTSGCK